ncbi:MAG: SPOR domain-containing protein [Bacteroidetes bacterium]|nr:SPOR domain-containing protein [Bacteroidota bacterium]
MKKKNWLCIPIKSGLLLISFFFFLNSYCQSDSLRAFAADSGIIQDKRVNELILKHVLINEAKRGTMKGYRVQIHFGAEKAKALDTKSKFTSQYKDIPAYLDYQQPYFKIRVGNFRTKLEAYKLLQEISDDFPGAFIVQDDIELPPL